ncbi:RGMC protein, partial [Crypturellus soui]|nr:RGMC protein [Crypturellus soui]
CKILRCNSDYVAATAGLRGAGSARTAAFCGALRSYAHCARRTARTCRGDLAFHSAVHGIEDLMIQNNCSKDGAASAPPPPRPRAPDRPRGLEICNYEKFFLYKHGQPPSYQHCAAFGDPHIRTFHDDFHTCRVEGSWPLLDNDYLFVQATSAPVAEGSNATVTSKVTDAPVILRWDGDAPVAPSWDGDARVPSSWDGDTPVAPSWDGDALVASSGDEDAPVILRWDGDAPVAPSWDGDARVPSSWDGDTPVAPSWDGDALVASSGDEDAPVILRWDGDAPVAPSWDGDALVTPTRAGTWGWGHVHACCPRGRVAPEAARALCKEALPVEDAYFQSCVFDVVTSGDAGFAAAARGALEDARVFLPDAGRIHIFQ